MNVQIQASTEAIRVLLEGDLDHEGAEVLKSSFASLELHNKKAVTFDFARVGYVGSAGLGKLLLFYKRLSSEKIQMRVEAASPAVKTLFQELRMDTLFTIA